MCACCFFISCVFFSIAAVAVGNSVDKLFIALECMGAMPISKYMCWLMVLVCVRTCHTHTQVEHFFDSSEKLLGVLYVRAEKENKFVVYTTHTHQ